MTGTLFEVTMLTMVDGNRYEYGQLEFEHFEVNWDSLGRLGLEVAEGFSP